jgi:hypothetical protein
VYKTDINSDVTEHTVTANKTTLYCGPQYGSSQNTVFDTMALAEGFQSASYPIKSEVFENGALDLELFEPVDGVKLCELWIKKQKN